MASYTSTLWLDFRPKRFSIMSRRLASCFDPLVLFEGKESTISVLRVLELLKLVADFSISEIRSDDKSGLEVVLGDAV